MTNEMANGKPTPGPIQDASLLHSQSLDEVLKVGQQGVCSPDWLVSEGLYGLFSCAAWVFPARLLILFCSSTIQVELSGAAWPEVQRVLQGVCIYNLAYLPAPRCCIRKAVMKFVGH